jgi:type IV pilus assembly protein PilF
MNKVITGKTVIPIRHRDRRPGLATVLLATLMLAACASQQPVDPDQKSSKRKAAESNTALGLEYMNRGQYEVALGKLKKATRDDPAYAPAQTVMAVLYERLGEFEEAGKHYRKAWEISPADGDVNNNYGVSLCQNGKRPQAMERFRAALDDPFYSSPSVALTNAGSCAMQGGDMPAADGYLRRALKIEPDFPDALMTMARLNYLERNYLKSRAFMQRYEAVAQHNAESLLLAYKIEMASSDSRAANLYKVLLETNFPESQQAEEVRRNPAQ